MHRQRLVHVRVERVALRLDRLDAGARERALELAVHEPDALDERVAVALRRDAERALEVVDDGEDLPDHADAGAGARRGHVLGRALAVVLEVRLRALGEVEVLVALAPRDRELVLGLGLGLGAWGYSRLGDGLLAAAVLAAVLVRDL